MSEPAPNIDDIRALLTEESGHFAALQTAFAAVNSELRIDKLGLARTVIDLVERDDSHDDVQVLRSNFRELFKTLRILQHEAEAEHRELGAQKQVRRAILGFLKQHPESATRDEVRLLLLDLDRLLDDSPWADAIRVAKLGIERDLQLTRDLNSDIANYPMVRKKLEGLLYAADIPATSPSRVPVVSEVVTDASDEELAQQLTNLEEISGSEVI